MKLITYAGGEFLTGDDIASALLRCGQALASDEDARSVTIPILNDDGSRGSAEFLVGPASQIVARDVDTEFDELVDTGITDELDRLVASLHPTARPEAAGERATWSQDDVY